MKIKFTTTAFLVDYHSEYCKYEATNPDPDLPPPKSRFVYSIYFDRELTKDEIESLERKFWEFYWAHLEIKKGGEV